MLCRTLFIDALIDRVYMVFLITSLLVTYVKVLIVGFDSDVVNVN